MAGVVTQVRSVYYRALMIVLFPFVFLATLFEDIAAGWWRGFAQGFFAAFSMGAMMALGLLAVYGIRSNF